MAISSIKIAETPLALYTLRRADDALILGHRLSEWCGHAQTLEEDMALDANDLPDEMDLASSEYLQSFTFRLRGREKAFLDKIDRALQKIEEGSFATCEECGEEISVKRLEARPETTLCIRCKEDQERMERDYS